MLLFVRLAFCVASLAKISASKSLLAGENDCFEINLPDFQLISCRDGRAYYNIGTKTFNYKWKNFGKSNSNVLTEFRSYYRLVSEPALDKDAERKAEEKVVPSTTSTSTTTSTTSTSTTTTSTTSAYNSTNTTPEYAEYEDIVAETWRSTAYPDQIYLVDSNRSRIILSLIVQSICLKQNRF